MEGKSNNSMKAEVLDGLVSSKTTFHSMTDGRREKHGSGKIHFEIPPFLLYDKFKDEENLNGTF